MPDIAEIERDPHWLPHALDMQAQRMQFVRITREVLSQPPFLADFTPDSAAGEVWLSFDQVKAMRPETGALHFIFHSAFCRSTLLVRALEVEGISAGLAEPGIIARLAGAGAGAAPLVKPVCDLLSRPWGQGEAVFVKPTNHANMLIPALLEARPDASAVLMTNGLQPFLRSVSRRGLMGRRWGRQLYLEMMGYAGMDLGMDGREQFSMTDLQAATLGWFLTQRMFAGLLAGPHGERLRVLDGDRFDAERADTLAAVFHLAGIEVAPEKIEAVVDGPRFRSHAKLGGDFAGDAGDTAAKCGVAHSRGRDHPDAAMDRHDRAAGRNESAAGPDAVLGAGVYSAAFTSPSRRKISSIVIPNISAMRKASGRLGSYLPVSMAFTLWRLTSSRSARSCWLHSRVARSTRKRFFMSALARRAHGHAVIERAGTNAEEPYRGPPEGGYMRHGQIGFQKTVDRCRS